jgi:hypothetical protein
VESGCDFHQRGLTCFVGLRLWREAAMVWRRGKPYGQDLRDRVLARGDAPLREVAARFGVGPSYVSKMRARLRELGERTPGPRRNHVPPRLAPLLDVLARASRPSRTRPSPSCGPGRWPSTGSGSATR